jgi:hypothetical protein
MKCASAGPAPTGGADFTVEDNVADERKDAPETGIGETGIGPSRRKLVKTAAQVAVTAPAVALLLSASTKPAAALTAYQAAASHILDDFTYGNNKDDILGPQDSPA